MPEINNSQDEQAYGSAASVLQGIGTRLNALQADIQQALQHQSEVLRVMTILPGKHRYEQVDAAITASGAAPMDIYMSLAADQHTFALARFYEALRGPEQKASE